MFVPPGVRYRFARFFRMVFPRHDECHGSRVKNIRAIHAKIGMQPVVRNVGSGVLRAEAVAAVSSSIYGNGTPLPLFR